VSRFIAFEGGEGGGKSTQMRSLADHLRGLGHEVITTREPGGSPRAEAIRDLLLADGTMTAATEALLFAAARADHVAHTVRPALQRGAVVLTDRYLDSSVAYQGGARGLGEDTIRDLSVWATQRLLPDLTIVLDIDPRIGLARALDPNRLESEPLRFHDDVRAAFLRMAAAEPERYVVIDASQAPGAVTAAVIAAVGPLLETSAATEEAR
jgi:dTMP kinase